MTTRRKLATWIGIFAGLATLIGGAIGLFAWAHEPYAEKDQVSADRVYVESSLKSISEQLRRQSEESHRRYCTGLLNEIVWLEQLQTEEHDTKREQRLIALRARYDSECSQ